MLFPWVGESGGWRSGERSWVEKFDVGAGWDPLQEWLLLLVLLDALRLSCVGQSSSVLTRPTSISSSSSSSVCHVKNRSLS